MSDAPAQALQSPEDIEASLKPRRRRWWLLLLLLLPLLALPLFLGSRESGQESAPRWKTQPITRGDIELVASASGTLEPSRSVTIGAEISGLVTDVLVEENDRVSAGQLLARIDTTALKNQRAQARAGLAGSRASIKRARAILADAKIKRERAQKLVEREVAAPTTLEEASALVQRAQADVEAAYASAARDRAAIDAIETQLSKAELTSPIDGVVLRRAIEPGSTVAASFQAPELFVLAEDLANMELEVLISEADISLVAPAQAATFSVDAWPQKTFEASVTSVSLSPTHNGNIVAYRTLLKVDNAERLLRPGMTAATTIATGKREQVLRVPNAALWFKPQEQEKSSFQFGKRERKSTEVLKGSAVHVLRDGEPRRIALTLGRSDEEWAELISGDLKQGDEVIVGQAEDKSEAAP